MIRFRSFVRRMRAFPIWLPLFIVIAASAVGGLASAMEGKHEMQVTQSVFGVARDGSPIELFTLENAGGMVVRAMTLGATLTAVEVPDRTGKRDNVTLYLETAEEYVKGHPCFGSVCGRYANRIALGRFVLDGVEYRLAQNNGPNHLHGGIEGFHKKNWTGRAVEGDGYVGVRFSLESPDGDEGYPGKLRVAVTYRLTPDNRLIMEYEAETDKPTVVNLTNHAYWNLAGAGEGDVLAHLLRINADRYLPVDATLIPLGPPSSVEGTPFDFRQEKAIGKDIGRTDGGYDHCFVLNRTQVGGLEFCAALRDPKSGRTMEVFTTQPGVQVYTANGLNGSLGAAGRSYPKHGAVCLETQHFPDSPNRPDYPSTVLRPGEKYHEVTVHHFSAD